MTESEARERASELARGLGYGDASIRVERCWVEMPVGSRDQPTEVFDRMVWRADASEELRRARFLFDCESGELLERDPS